MIGRRAARGLRDQILVVVAILFAATALTFAITQILPGDAAVAILGDTATEAEIASLRAELGLERSLIVRYVEWLVQALSSDLGRSWLPMIGVSNNTVTVATRWPGEPPAFQRPDTSHPDKRVIRSRTRVFDVLARGQTACEEDGIYTHRGFVVSPENVEKLITTSVEA